MPIVLCLAYSCITLCGKVGSFAPLKAYHHQNSQKQLQLKLLVANMDNLVVLYASMQLLMSLDRQINLCRNMSSQLVYFIVLIHKKSQTVKSVHIHVVNYYCYWFLFPSFGTNRVLMSQQLQQHKALVDKQVSPPAVTV